MKCCTCASAMADIHPHSGVSSDAFNVVVMFWDGQEGSKSDDETIGTLVPACSLQALLQCRWWKPLPEHLVHMQTCGIICHRYLPRLYTAGAMASASPPGSLTMPDSLSGAGPQAAECRGFQTKTLGATIRLLSHSVC